MLLLHKKVRNFVKRKYGLGPVSVLEPGPQLIVTVHNTGTADPDPFD